MFNDNVKIAKFMFRFFMLKFSKSVAKREIGHFGVIIKFPLKKLQKPPWPEIILYTNFWCFCHWASHVLTSDRVRTMTIFLSTNYLGPFSYPNTLTFSPYLLRDKELFRFNLRSEELEQNYRHNLVPITLLLHLWFWNGNQRFVKNFWQ